MLGAIIGDIVGSIYEWNPIKSKDFPFFAPEAHFTDDTVMTCAVAAALMRSQGEDESTIRESLVQEMQRWGRRYPQAGYGAHFHQWLYSDHPQPYHSLGNGSAMRVSFAGWLAPSREEAERLARLSAEVTHNHPEGIRGAQAVAAAIYMARRGCEKPTLREYIEEHYYPLAFRLDQIRPTYHFDVTCPGSVPQAIVAFLESHDFEDAVRNAVSLGGDSDTIAAIAGSIAEAYYGIPFALQEQVRRYLDDELWSIVLKGQEAAGSID